MWLLWLVFSLVGLGVFLAYRFKEEKQRKDKIISRLAGIGWLGFGGVFMWITRPWWHWLWFKIFYMNLTFWIFTVLIIVGLSLICWLRRNAQKKEETKRTAWDREETLRERKWLYILTGLGLWIILMIILAIFGPAITKVKIYHSIAPIAKKIEELPETNMVRYLPLEVAFRYGENKVQESEVKLGDIDPIFSQYYDEFIWVVARIPNGFWRSLSFNADGFALIRSNGDVEMIRQSMKYGEGMYITDNIIWKLREKKYWVDIPAIYYFQYITKYGEEVIGIAPYLSFRYQFPVMVPYWGGVFVFYDNGQIEDFTPEEIQALPYTLNQPLFPEKLTKLYVNSWAYKNGIWNAWFTHKDQVKIPSIEYTPNQMPFLLPTAEGLEWMTATVPWGGRGLFKIFFIDAHTGKKIRVYEVPKESTWIGPNAIWDYIKTSLPMYNWYRRTGEGSTGNIIAVEPRPVIKAKKLYWMSSITNIQYGGVSETVLVDSQNPTRILSFKREEELKRFLIEKVYVKPIEEPLEETPSIQQLQRLKELLQQILSEFEELEKILTK